MLVSLSTTARKTKNSSQKFILYQKNLLNVFLSPTTNVRPCIQLEICDFSFTFRNFFACIRNLFGCHVIARNPAAHAKSPT